MGIDIHADERAHNREIAEANAQAISAAIEKLLAKNIRIKDFSKEGLRSTFAIKKNDGDIIHCVLQIKEFPVFLEVASIEIIIRRIDHFREIVGRRKYFFTEEKTDPSILEVTSNMKVLRDYSKIGIGGALLSSGEKVKHRYAALLASQGKYNELHSFIMDQSYPIGWTTKSILKLGYEKSADKTLSFPTFTKVDKIAATAARSPSESFLSRIWSRFSGRS